MAASSGPRLTLLGGALCLGDRSLRASGFAGLDESSTRYPVYETNKKPRGGRDDGSVHGFAVRLRDCRLGSVVNMAFHSCHLLGVYNMPDTVLSPSRGWSPLIL